MGFSVFFIVEEIFWEREIRGRKSNYSKRFFKMATIYVISALEKCTTQAMKFSDFNSLKCL